MQLNQTLKIEEKTLLQESATGNLKHCHHTPNHQYSALSVFIFIDVLVNEKENTKRKETAEEKTAGMGGKRKIRSKMWSSEVFDCANLTLSFWLKCSQSV